MDKHTPGPWHVEMCKYILDTENTLVAEVLDRFDDSAQQKNSIHANALLIAAAPDLLVILEKIATRLEKSAMAWQLLEQNTGDDLTTVKDARALIAKIKGE